MRAALTIAMLLLAGCEPRHSLSVITGEAMGTTYRIKHIGDFDGRALQPLLEALDADLSTWRDDSWVARFNRAPAGEAMLMPESVRELITLSQVLHAQTGGRFDPSIGALLKVWGFGAWQREFESDPSDEEVAAAQQASGLHRLIVEGGRLTKTHDGLMLDFSAIAKGYAVDRMAEVLSAAGCEDFLIEFGGDLLARGHAPGKTGWTVDGPALDGPIHLLDEAIATSGSEHQFHAEKSHILDPLLGHPALAGAPVSARAPSCAEADALATARYVESAGSRTP